MERDNGDLWKQVCRNSYPHVAANLPNNMDHRLLVLGLWCGEKTSTPAARKTVYTPTLGLDDVFAVVELYKKAHVSANKKRKNAVYSWMLPISFPSLTHKEMGDKEEKLVWKAPNPFSSAEQKHEEVQTSRKTPFAFAFQKIAGCDLSRRDFDGDSVFRVSVTLFRRDNKKSVRVLDEVNVMGWDSEYAGNFAQYLYCYGEYLAFAPSDAGNTARSMMYGSGLTDLEATATITFSPNLPVAGSDEEPEWLTNCRRDIGEGFMYFPNHEEQVALSRISDFEFELRSIELGVNVRKGGFGSHFENENDLMVALEGLCWE